jgi:hypothetical protein
MRYIYRWYLYSDMYSMMGSLGVRHTYGYVSIIGPSRWRTHMPSLHSSAIYLILSHILYHLNYTYILVYYSSNHIYYLSLYNTYTSIIFRRNSQSSIFHLYDTSHFPQVLNTIKDLYVPKKIGHSIILH